MDKVSRPTFFFFFRASAPVKNLFLLSTSLKSFLERKKRRDTTMRFLWLPAGPTFFKRRTRATTCYVFSYFHSLSLSYSFLLNVFIIIIVESIMIPFPPWRWGMASWFIVVCCRDSPPVCILDLLFSIRSSPFDPLAGVWGFRVCTTVNDAFMALTKGIRERERERVETRTPPIQEAAAPLLSSFFDCVSERRKICWILPGKVSIKKRRNRF